METYGQPEVKGDAGKVLRWINTCGIGLGIWFALQFWNDFGKWKEEARAEVKQLQTSVYKIELDGAKVESSRFTSNDWVKAKDSIDQKHNDLDRRVGKVEDGLSQIKESLSLIKSAVGVPSNGKE